ncbi:MAG: phosphoribosyl-ATP diphosphatase [Pyrobaculum sp.]
MSCDVLDKLEKVIRDRVAEASPESYTYRLVSAGVPHVARKVGEEAVELAVAALAEDDKRVVEESADLLYHLLVLLHAKGLTLADVCEELRRRMK